MRKIIIAYFTSLLIAVGAQRGYVTDYDFTTPEKSKLFDAAGVDELRILPDRMVYNHLYGIYTGFSDYTGGFALGIYPDGVVILHEFADIWRGKIIGQGSWKYTEGKVIIKWSSLKFDGMMSKEFFDKNYGISSELVIFVSAKNEILKEAILVSVDKVEPVIHSFYIQRIKYVDWAKERDTLIERSE